MRRIQVIPVSLPAEVGALMDAWWAIHANHPSWTPPLWAERKRFLDPAHNAWLRRWTFQFFLAKRDEAPVGTICAHFDPTDSSGVGFFGFFEFVEDQGVAATLLAAVAEWQMEHGIERIQGPFQMVPSQGYGLKVGGPSCACLLDPQARAYYPGAYEKLGFSVHSAWTSWWFDLAAEPPRVTRVAARVSSRDIVIRALEPASWEVELRHLAAVVAEAGADAALVGLLEHLRDWIEPELIWFAFEGERCLGASVAIPDLTPIIRKMRGKMLPFGWYHWWFGRQKIEALRLLSVSVVPTARHRGILAALYHATREAALRMGALGLEYPPVLDDDAVTKRFLTRLGAREHARYQIYEAELSSDFTEELMQ